jgi:hypothetical protein
MRVRHVKSDFGIDCADMGRSVLRPYGIVANGGGGLG